MKKSAEYYWIVIAAVLIVAFGILYFIFNFSKGVFLQPVPAGAVNLSSCANLDINGTYYVLNTSLLGVNTANLQNNCLKIIGNNIVVDGLGKYIITGNNATGSTGVLIEGNNAVVKNLNISGYETGIAVRLSNGSTIYRDVFYNNSFANINISFSNYTNVTGNLMSLSSVGIGIENGYNNELTENGIYNVAHGMIFGIIALGGSGNSFVKNTISKTDYGIYLHTASLSFLKNNVVSECAANGIFILNSNAKNSVFGGMVSTCGQSGLHIENTQEVLFDGFNVTGINNQYYDLEVVGTSKIGFVETYLARYSFPAGGINATFKDVGNGEIAFLNPINGSGNNLSADVKIKFDFAEVNSSQTGLNRAANISFEGLPTNFVAPQIKRNGLECPANICTALAGLNTGNVVFRVTGWTNYSIGDSVNSTIQSLNIEEPDENDTYRTNQFPVQFRVDLNMNGSVTFNLTQGSNSVFNATMNTTNNKAFTYNLPSLSLGNYTFKARAVFINGTVLIGQNNFRVLPALNGSGSTGGTTGGGTGGTGSGSGNNTGQFNQTAINGTGSGFGGTGNNSLITNGTGSSGGTGPSMRNIAYWLIIVVLVLAIVVLSILILRYLRNKTTEPAPQIVGSVVSGLR